MRHSGIANLAVAKTTLSHDYGYENLCQEQVLRKQLELVIQPGGALLRDSRIVSLAATLGDFIYVQNVTLHKCIKRNACSRGSWGHRRGDSCQVKQLEIQQQGQAGHHLQAVT